MGFFISYIVTASSLLGIAIGGAWVGLGLLFSLFINVILDESLKDYQIQSPFLRRWILHPGLGELALVLQPVLLAAYMASAFWLIKDLSGWQWAIAVYSVSMVIGVMVLPAAHELIHRSSPALRALGVLSLSTINFASYRISHLEIHHRYVGTEMDPSTAKADQKIWSFLYQSFVRNWQGAFAFEKQRVGLFSFQNRFWHYTLLKVAFGALIWIFMGPMMLLAWALISVNAILFLEGLEFSEHKGLQRARGEQGHFLPVRAQHSIDCHYLISNLVYFSGGYHAHHHMQAAVDFAHLEEKAGTQVMPYGQSLTVLMALGGFDVSPVSKSASQRTSKLRPQLAQS